MVGTRSGNLEILFFADAVKQTRPISMYLRAIFLSRRFLAECWYSIYLSRHIKADTVLVIIEADLLTQTMKLDKTNFSSVYSGNIDSDERQ